MQGIAHDHCMVIYAFCVSDIDNFGDIHQCGAVWHNWWKLLLLHDNMLIISVLLDDII